MRTIHWSAAIKASLIAGVAYLIVQLALVATLGGESVWGPARMIGAILLGEDVLPPPVTFHPASFLAAIVIHFGLSIIYGVIFALISERATWQPGVATIVGRLFGLAIYAINFYGMTAFFPWFAVARNGISIFAHAVFGMVLGYSYRKLAPYLVVA